MCGPAVKHCTLSPGVTSTWSMGMRNNGEWTGHVGCSPNPARAWLRFPCCNSSWKKGDQGVMFKSPSNNTSPGRSATQRVISASSALRRACRQEALGAAGCGPSRVTGCSPSWKVATTA